MEISEKEKRNFEEMFLEKIFRERFKEKCLKKKIFREMFKEKRVGNLRKKKVDFSN